VAHNSLDTRAITAHQAVTVYLAQSQQQVVVMEVVTQTHQRQVDQAVVAQLMALAVRLVILQAHHLHKVLLVEIQ
jgi:hypothetical protein